MTVAAACAQTDCDAVLSQLSRWEERIGQLTEDDPELIALHYLFLQDIQRDLYYLRNRQLPTLVDCPDKDYYQLRAAYQRVKYKADAKDVKLKNLRDHVDDIFYQKAAEELYYNALTQCHYFLDRALQYNPLHADALLMKAQLQLREEQFDEAVETIHVIYTKTVLTEEQERRVSDFTLELYEQMYNKGQWLVQQGRAAEALEVFQTLEHFCNNMPSGYCNDDYYRGILVSREGVYESYLAIAREAVEAVRSAIRGIHVSAPFGNVATAIAVMKP